MLKDEGFIPIVVMFQRFHTNFVACYKKLLNVGDCLFLLLLSYLDSPR